MHSALTAASVDATGAPIPAEQGGQRGMPCVAAGIGLAYNPGLVSYYTGVNPVRDIQYVAPRLKCLCVRDHSGAVGEAVFPRLGGGDVDYMAILAALTGLGFSGPVVVEHLGIEPAPDRSPDELDGAAKAAFRFLDMVLRRL